MSSGMNWEVAMERFVLANHRAERFHREFTIVLTGTNLMRDESLERVLDQYRKIAGIYFWVMAHEERKYSIYIGMAGCLSRRLMNYISDFQAHSPNDYKLQIFHAFMSEFAPSATLDLYFAPMSSDRIGNAETESVSFYDPLLNHLPAPSAHARQALKDAFAEYYRSAITNRLNT
jgi:hypothetical protein